MILNVLIKMYIMPLYSYITSIKPCIVELDILSLDVSIVWNVNQKTLIIQSETAYALYTYYYITIEIYLFNYTGNINCNTKFIENINVFFELKTFHCTDHHAIIPNILSQF